MSELGIKEMGTNAQKVWSTLCSAVSGISIQELCKQLALTFEEVIMAIRWLSKDHNIGLASKEGHLMLIGASTVSSK
ncbi:winged helix-turn-helix domain-containing protein [Bacteroides sp. OttesenSCG-928-E20]|nr:winged helix-turn-helix domain-containing protein [Bacteroides sp. OttesenSCG-928-N06]MDL2299303.1 winged helix-turn-helix domain-containing protein [Bacteroides sp. OttesenSCG-928-E20]